MKNNIVNYFIVFLVFLFLFENKVNSQEIQFNASEIQSLDDGNKIIAYNGVEIIWFKNINGLGDQC